MDGMTGSRTIGNPTEPSLSQAQIDAFKEGLKRDERVPSRGNLSGVWASRDGLIFRLEQNGTHVSGRSFQYEYGCIGLSLNEVDGSVAGEILTLRVRQPNKEFTARAFELVSTAAGLSLREFVEGTILFPK